MADVNVVGTIVKFPAPPLTTPWNIRVQCVNIDSMEHFRVQEDSKNYWPWACRRLCRARDGAQRGSGCQRWGTQYPRPRACSAFFHSPHPYSFFRVVTNRKRERERQRIGRRQRIEERYIRRDSKTINAA